MSISLFHNLGVVWPRSFLERFWVPVPNRIDSVRPLWFIATLLVFGTVLIWIVPQGRDVVATLSDGWAEGSESSRWYWFLAALCVLSLQAWLWSRLLIDVLHLGRQNWGKDWLLRELPRLLGVWPFFAAAVAIMFVPPRDEVELWDLAPQAGILTLCGLAAYFLFWKRYALMSRLASWKRARALFDPLPLWGISRFDFYVLSASLILSLVILGWLAVDPVTFPITIGSGAVAFLAFALFIPVVSVLMVLVLHRRLSVVWTLLLISVVVSGISENHQIREIVGGQVVPKDRPSMEEAYRAFVAQAPRLPEDQDTVPVVLVSAAGGASRAALWTVAVLGALDDQQPNFHHTIFAISAVSGGSLGAVDYVAGLHVLGSDSDPRTRRDLAWDHAQGDFLAPALGGMFFTDLVQRFLPFSLFRDRSESIEKGFEVHWDDMCAARAKESNCVGLFRNSFLSLWPAPNNTWQPNLLLVGAIQENGRRIITSNIDLVDRPNNRAWIPNSFDYFGVTNRPIRTSTAVMNSARFPWISPAGSFYGIDTTKNERILRGHIVDGGYYETSGAETSVDLSHALVETRKRICNGRVDKALCPKLRFIFVTLENEEQLEYDWIDKPRGRVTIAPKGLFNLTPERTPIANDLLAPVRGLFSAQGGRAEATLSRLLRQDQKASDDPDHVYEVRLRPCRDVTERPLAMNWVLSKPSRGSLSIQLYDDEFVPKPTKPLLADRPCRNRQQVEISHLAQALGIPNR
jgi:hypothetical protein